MNHPVRLPPSIAIPIGWIYNRKIQGGKETQGLLPSRFFLPTNNSIWNHKECFAFTFLLYT